MIVVYYYVPLMIEHCNFPLFWLLLLASLMEIITHKELQLDFYKVYVILRDYSAILHYDIAIFFKVS